MVSTGRVPTWGSAASGAWRTRDIVVTAVIAVAFGVVFQAWNAVWEITRPLYAALVWPEGFLYGVWLIPAVLAPLIIRKPGAALFAELVAAGVSAFLGSQFGADALLSGLLQGLGAEVVFLATRYRNYRFPVLALAAIGSATLAWIHDWVLYYATFAPDIQLLRGGAMAVSAVILTAGGSVLLVRALRETGVLEGFPD